MSTNTTGTGMLPFASLRLGLRRVCCIELKQRYPVMDAQTKTNTNPTRNLIAPATVSRITESGQNSAVVHL
ncbi:MAG: hypothetical protein WC082_02820 [Victivallales bacterium]